MKTKFGHYSVQILTIICLTLSLSAICGAQEKDNSADKKGEVVSRLELAPDMQQVFMKSNADVNTASASLEIAKLRFENLLLRLRAVLKVPEDFEARVDDLGRLYFEKPKEEKNAEPAKP